MADYLCTAWSPYTAKGIAAVESIQRRAARFVFSQDETTTSVTARSKSSTENPYRSGEPQATLFYFTRYSTT